MSAAQPVPPHAEFVAAYRAGRARVAIDRAGAARFVSARTLLPLVLLPVLGVAVALALLGHFVIGGLVFVATLALRQAVRASGRGFVLSRALADAEFYRAVCAAGILRVELDAAPA
jgi:hypothetical protein